MLLGDDLAVDLVLLALLFFKLKVAPGAKGNVAQPVRYAELANVAAAHVDAFTCSDGTQWKR